MAERHAHTAAAEALEPIAEEDEDGEAGLAREISVVEEECEDEQSCGSRGPSGQVIGRIALLGCAKATGIRVWNSCLWAPVENDATGTLPGICVKDGLQLAAVLGITARIYLPVLMGDAFLTTPGSNGVLGTTQ